MFFLLICIRSFQEVENKIAIEITGNLFFSSQYLMDNNHVLEDKISIENLIKSIITKYTDVGFPFCQVYPEIVRIDDSIEKVILRIHEGDRVVISDYIFDIEGKTEPSVVKKVIQLEPGIYFSSKKIEHSKRNLMKTGVFHTIQENLLYRNDNYFLLFGLKEKNSDFAVATGSFSQDRFDFNVTFSSINLLGTLRRLHFHYDYQKLFSLEFTEPVLLFPIEIAGKFSLSTYDSLRLIQYNGKITAPLGQYFKVSLSSGLETVSYYGDNSPTQKYTNNLVGIGLGMSHETSKLSSEQTINTEYLFRHNNRWKIQYDGEFNMMSIIIKSHYYVTKTDSFEYFDYYRIGGVTGLRGYLDEEFTTSKALWFETEFKKLFIFPIFDIGLIDDNIYFSYGFGIEAQSDIVYTALIIAWPKQGTWQDGKIHLILEKDFD